MERKRDIVQDTKSSLPKLPLLPIGKVIRT